jgi:hypothetical protein
MSVLTKFPSTYEEIIHDTLQSKILKIKSMKERVDDKAVSIAQGKFLPTDESRLKFKIQMVSGMRDNVDHIAEKALQAKLKYESLVEEWKSAKMDVGKYVDTHKDEVYYDELRKQFDHLIWEDSHLSVYEYADDISFGAYSLDNFGFWNGYHKRSTTLDLSNLSDKIKRNKLF